jgi:capsid protein
LAVRIPFEVLLQHFSASYSASIAATLAAEKMFALERDGFADMLNQAVWEEFLVEAVIKERLSAPGFLTDPYIRLAYSGAYWQGPEQGHLDETKAVQSALMRVEYGFSTRAREAERLTGMTYADIVAAQSVEKELAEKYGLVFGTGNSPNVETSNEGEQDEQSAMQ